MRDLHELLRENAELTQRLREAEETLEAIRTGAVDALVVTTPEGVEQLFTLEGADSVYRIFLESIAEGALTLNEEGIILYANDSAHRLLSQRGRSPLGMPLRACVRQEDRTGFDTLLGDARHGSSAAEIRLRGPVGGRPVSMSLRRLDGQADAVMVAVLTDLTERKRAELAREEERSRLARDLHDSVTQALFAASLKAEALTVEGMVSGKACGVVEEVARLNRGALAQMRTLLLELRGQPIEEVPIRQLLRSVTEATEGRSSVKVSLTVEGDESLPAALHVAVYRITQEALNNVARHARAENAWVSLNVTDSSVSLVVGDDGCGYEPSALDESHMGLATMAERAREAEARLLTSTAPGKGTVLTLIWRATDTVG